MNKVLLIGNAPTVLNKKRGQEIDAFDGKIIRFNHYRTDSYLSFVGSRTDILVLGQLNVEEHLDKKFDYILIYQTHLDGGDGMRKVKGLSPHNTVLFFPLSEKDRLKRLLDLEKTVEPTTGIVAIHWFIEIQQASEIYIHGFDFSEEEYFTSEKELEIEKFHDTKKEKSFVESLVRQGKIKWF